MSNPSHFRNRAAAYCQLAQQSPNLLQAGDMFEIASMFNAMADDLEALNRSAVRRSQPVRRPILQFPTLRSAAHSRA